MNWKIALVVLVLAGLLAVVIYPHITTTGENTNIRTAFAVKVNVYSSTSIKNPGLYTTSILLSPQPSPLQQMLSFFNMPMITKELRLTGGTGDPSEESGGREVYDDSDSSGTSDDSSDSSSGGTSGSPIYWIVEVKATPTVNGENLDLSKGITVEMTEYEYNIGNLESFADSKTMYPTSLPYTFPDGCLYARWKVNDDDLIDGSKIHLTFKASGIDLKGQTVTGSTTATKTLSYTSQPDGTIEITVDVDYSVS